MKRTFISLSVIVLLISLVVILDLVFMTKFADGMTSRLDLIVESKSVVEQKELAEELDLFYKSKEFIAHRIIPTDRIEEIETMLHKLNAYIGEEDENEIGATAAEIRSRVNLLYSTYVYHWHHPLEFRIE